MSSGTIRQRHDLPVELINWHGDDLSVVHAARVSTGRETTDFAEAEIGLIRYLMNNKHGTPFEHNSMTFRIEAPIFVWSEFHRHRIGFSYNEESGRYKQLKPEFYLPKPARPLVQKGKVGHYTFEPGEIEQWNLVSRSFYRQQSDCYAQYQLMLENGIAKEVARMVLPVSIYSTCYVTCNARSLMSFLELRMAPNAMWEIRSIAHSLYGHMEKNFPIVSEAFEKAGYIAP